MNRGDVLKVKLSKVNTQDKVFNALVISVSSNNPIDDTSIVNMINLDNMHPYIVNLSSDNKYKSPNNKFGIEVIDYIKEMSTSSAIVINQDLNDREVYLNVNTYSKKNLSYSKKRVKILEVHHDVVYGRVKILNGDKIEYYDFNDEIIAVGMNNYCINLIYFSND